MKRQIIVLFVIMLIIKNPHFTLPKAPLAWAQGGGDNDSTNTIHVVQRGENLFRIAQQYGTTVEAITAANGITDVRFLEVGQRLIIPNAQKQTLGVATTHTVQPGETLTTIARRYGTSPQTLARLNNITHYRTLFAGQAIQVNQGEDAREPIDNITLYSAQPDDNLLRIAAQFGIPYPLLLDVNNGPAIMSVYNGQQIVLPGQASGRFQDLPDPLVSLDFGPLPVHQGETLRLMFQTREPVEASLNFMGRDVPLVALENNHYGTMLGVHALTEPGVYQLRLSFVNSDNQTMFYPVNFEVLDGGYGFETIDIPPEREDLLAANIVQAEQDKIVAIMSQFTNTFFPDGLLALPAPGAVTSNYGTRRSYNGSQTITFHGGADFGGAAGTPITAPASGTVVLVEPLQVRGNVVIIDHGWGVYTGYWHQQATYMVVGQFVRKGEEIGSIGSTGLSTGAHLHWEMWVSGVQVNPLQWTQVDFAPLMDS